MKKPVKFTELFIKNKLQPKETKYEYREGGGDGFAVRVHPNGTKTWITIYHFDRKKKRISHGSYPSMKLTDARTAHRETVTLVEKGFDPGKASSCHTKMTVAQLKNEYIERWAKPRKKSWKEDERILRVEVVPVIGCLPIDEVTRRDVVLLTDAIIDRGHLRMAQVTYSIVRRMFNFGVERGAMETSPCAMIRLPDRTPSKSRFLSADEIREFWYGLEFTKATESIKRGLKFILATGQRPGEVMGLAWPEIDGDWWQLPAERSKNKLPHSTFLNSVAKSLLVENDSAFAFPGPKGERFSENKESRILLRAQGIGVKCGPVITVDTPFTPHDLRRTCATHLAELGFSLVVPKILNHKDRTVTGIYNRYDFRAEKEEALTAWGERLFEILDK